mmetsp:Transcript_6576/g.17098  ORF Transcript_6576/g.17098 Transcript_6576/m.17098 type:complete len:237 (-) Transcript_6576:783-1493(-)
MRRIQRIIMRCIERGESIVVYGDGWSRTHGFFFNEIPPLASRSFLLPWLPRLRFIIVLCSSPLIFHWLHFDRAGRFHSFMTLVSGIILARRMAIKRRPLLRVQLSFPVLLPLRLAFTHSSHTGFPDSFRFAEFPLFSLLQNIFPGGFQSGLKHHLHTLEILVFLGAAIALLNPKRFQVFRLSCFRVRSSFVFGTGGRQIGPEILLEKIVFSEAFLPQNHCPIDVIVVPGKLHFGVQ